MLPQRIKWSVSHRHYCAIATNRSEGCCVQRVMNLLQDVRFALRQLLQNRTVTLVAMCALALGIGANTAIFSVVNAVLLRPLPYRDPGRIVTLLMPPSSPLSGGDFNDIKVQARSFEAVAAAEGWGGNLGGAEK